MCMSNPIVLSGTRPHAALTGEDSKATVLFFVTKFHGNCSSPGLLFEDSRNNLKQESTVTYFAPCLQTSNSVSQIHRNFDQHCWSKEGFTESDVFLLNQHITEVLIFCINGTVVAPITGTVKYSLQSKENFRFSPNGSKFHAVARKHKISAKTPKISSKLVSPSTLCRSLQSQLLMQIEISRESLVSKAVLSYLRI